MDRETVSTGEADPRQHMLSTHRHQWDGNDRAVREVVTFLEQVEASRKSLQTQPDGEPARTVELSGAEILVAASLLREFSARLRLDTARGAVSAEAEQLAQLSDDIVDRFYTATGLRG
jgi:hypothetical protein